LAQAAVTADRESAKSSYVRACNGTVYNEFSQQPAHVRLFF
jgi:hypothetical protein